MAEQEQTDPSAHEAASREAGARDAAEAREAVAVEHARTADEIARLIAEGADRAARDAARVETERARARTRLAPPTAGRLYVTAAEGSGFGKTISIRVQDREGNLQDLEAVFGMSDGKVRFVYGEQIGVDAETGAVTVPKEIAAKDLPLLAREMARAARVAGPSSDRPSDHRSKALQKEFDKKKELERGVAEMQENYSLWDFADTRARYKKLEEAHSQAVQDAEKAIEGLMPAMVEKYRHVTGRDLYEEAGGEKKTKETVRKRLLEEQAGLVFKYDSKGKRYLTGDFAEGVDDMLDLSYFDAMARLYNNSETVRDFRIRNKMVKMIKPAEDATDRLQNVTSKLVHLPPHALLTFGKTGALSVLATGAFIIDQPRKLLTWGLNTVDAWYTGAMNAIGKWWLGKDLKLESVGEKQKKAEEAIEKTTKEKMGGK